MDFDMSSVDKLTAIGILGAGVIALWRELKRKDDFLRDLTKEMSAHLSVIEKIEERLRRHLEREKE